jgi:high-affinity iron transporter
MLPAFLIMLREGLEAALITSIIAGYLARTGRAKAMGGIWLGMILAVLVSLATGFGLHQWADEFPEDQYALFEGLVSLVAAALLITMVFWMRRAARSLRSDLHAAVDRTLAGTAAFWPLVALAFLAVVREGLESAFFLLALMQQAGAGLALLGAALGLALAVVLGLALYRGSLALDLRAFFRWTGAFIVVVAAGLVGTAVHEFAELGLWTFLPQPAYDLRAVLPRDGLPGSILSGLIGYRDHGSLGEMLVYLGFLATALTLYFWPRPQLPTVQAR